MARKNQRYNPYLDPIFHRYYNRLSEIAMSRFEWCNLPKSCNERFLEQTLFKDGYALFFKDDELGDYLALQCMISGQLNVYRIPKNRRAFATNGYQLERDETNSIIIYNNYVHTNDISAIRSFALELTELSRSSIINIKAQKTPILLLCDEKQRAAIENLYELYEGNAPVIYGDKSLGSEPIRPLSTGAPFVCDKLYELKVKIWNEALTYLGITNVAVEKKERLISDEVERQNGGTLASRSSALKMREEACKEINEMFGLNISVKFREEPKVQSTELRKENNSVERIAES